MNYIDLIERKMKESGEDIFSSNAADLETINLFELSLGVIFPESYRIFLQKYGTLAFGGESFYGITRKGINGNSVPCVLFVTKGAREMGDIDDGMIKIKSSGYGPSFSIDTKIVGKSGEPVIVETELSFKYTGIKTIIADNFSEFLLVEIERAIEDL